VLAQEQGLEPLERRVVVGCVLQHPRVRGDRLIDVAEVRLERVREPKLELDEQVGVHLDADPPLQDLGELDIHARRGVDAIERRE
jgi:hypothetical protein